MPDTRLYTRTGFRVMGLTLLLRRWLLQLVMVTGVAVVTEVLVLEQCILTGGQTGERHEARYRRRGTRMINAN